MKKNYLLILYLLIGFSVFSQTEQDTTELKKQDTSFAKEGEIKDFKVYPNPVSNGIIHISTFNNKAKTVKIYDVLGKQVINRKTQTNHVSVASLKPGVYILKVIENSKTATRKLVVK